MSHCCVESSSSGHYTECSVSGAYRGPQVIAGAAREKSATATRNEEFRPGNYHSCFTRCSFQNLTIRKIDEGLPQPPCVEIRPYDLKSLRITDEVSEIVFRL
ncbi:hypothetical protein CLF_111913 [Clonorchis sinensis]|uniref:Uncharacterized protein n=1 Tax=Clonorchis sinensis TaxID=79923 RepID=G7YM40_CLOSI|nr:hypothetical protein CLF_111913 [Clonorchis sinensis]